MKFSIDWLQKLVTVKDSVKMLAEKITGAGLEVEAIENDVIELKIPPNRADCLGMVGLAREVAAVYGQKFSEPNVKTVPAKINDIFNLQVQDPAACPKYIGRIIKGIDNTRQTPQWIQDCLTTAGMNLISPVVDVTNYILLEWGQPLHAFDVRKLSGDIIVRKAKAGEELTLLDETKVKLTPQTLLIADSKKSLALAGLKGGKDSGIGADTKDVLLECAYFEPVGVRLTSRQLNVQSDGSYRFERGVDPAMQEKVMEHLTQMLLDIVGGEPGPIVSFCDLVHLPKTTVITLRMERIKKILGISIDIPTATAILQRLGFQVETQNSHAELMITVPSFRPDITGEVDLIEEVGRIYGFQNIPAQVTHGVLEFQPLPEATISEQKITECLANRGYNEAITYSFIDLQYAKLFAPSVNEDLCLTNPISSEMGFMRPSLLPGLLKAIQYNQNRQQERIRLFEIGLRFTGSADNVQQRKTIAGACYGNYLPEGWGAAKRQVDLFDVKSDVLALLELSRNADHVKFKPTTDVAMHPGQALDIYLHDKLLGKVGVLHPKLQQTLELPNPVVMFEMDYALVANGNLAAFSLFSKFPSVRRDIALLMNRDIAAGNLEQAIRKEVDDLLIDLVIFDVYQGKGIADNQKSMALGLTLQHPERTLTDAEVNDIFANLIAMLQREFKATLR